MQDKVPNTTKNKYLIIPSYLKQEKTQKFTTIALTLVALSFFGFFAINPTISTIGKLKKEISDNEFVYKELEKKIVNLSSLRKQYSILQKDIPLITTALPKEPNAQILIAQIQAIAQNSNVHIKKLQNFEVELFKNNKGPNKKYFSYSFTIAGNGTYENISKFVSTLTNMQRVANIDTLTINKSTSQTDRSLELSIQGTSFFKE